MLSTWRMPNKRRGFCWCLNKDTCGLQVFYKSNVVSKWCLGFLKKVFSMVLPQVYIIPLPFQPRIKALFLGLCLLYYRGLTDQ